MAGDLELMVARLGESLADPAPLNVLCISQFARERGMKVLLSGAGGDDLFTGHRRHRAMKVERRWAKLPYAVRLSVARAIGGRDHRRAWGLRYS